MPNASSGEQQQLPVNWLYGAYIPKEAPFRPLDDADRWRLYVRQTYTTPGIYIKIGLFTVRDQIQDVPPEWERTGEGFAKRLGSRYAQFVIQNSFTALGNAMPGWEPRYDRCRCSGFWNRSKHAFVRNFVTYAADERSLRPQVFLYAASFGGASLAAMWEPGNPNILVKGYQGAISQTWVGVFSNLLGEFAPDIKRALRRKKNVPLEQKN